MIEALIGLIFGLGIGYYAQPEVKEQTPMMQCSIACGKDRMVEYHAAHGTCICEK